MSATAFAYRHCRNCSSLKPAEEFLNHGYCLECKRKYGRDRYAALKAGEWEPKAAGERASVRPKEIVREVMPAPAEVTSGHAVYLKESMIRFMRAHGFTAFRSTLTRLENEIAREHRDMIAPQGWIV